MGVMVEVRPGYCYEVTLPAPDGVAVGARWVAGRAVQGGGAGAGPLEPMYRRRLIVKLDDLQSFSLARFQAFVGAVGAHGGKADLGINPGKCGREVYGWLRTLDPSRFEVWNHTWDHGAFGPLHRGLPLEVQLAHLDMVQEKVKREVGVTPRAFGQPGIRHQEGWIGDQDEVTYLAVRAHPDLVAIYDGGSTVRQLGLEEELDPLFGPVSLSGFEWPPNDWVRGDPKGRYRVEYVARQYPDEDPDRPPVCGNAEEMLWRVDHPAADLSHVDRQGAAYAQFHPWHWTKGSDIEAVGEWVEAITARQQWRFSNCYEAYRWRRDCAHLALEKTAPDRYLLDAHLLRHTHELELALPAASRVEARAYVVPLA
jgi:peptidoglycan/xylan/chitin deacetylase (PgdA/CDA1 family)